MACHFYPFGIDRNTFAAAPNTKEAWKCSLAGCPGGKGAGLANR